MPDVGSFFVVGIVAAVVTFATTPLVGRLAVRMGWVYEPNERTVHTHPLPDVGGIAMFLGCAVGLAVAWTMGDFESLFASNSEPIGVVIAALIIFATGFVDDIHELSAPAKVFGTVLAGVALVYFGVVMYSFHVPYLGTVILSPDLQPLVTVLWLIGMSHAINLIDGLDGLAAGVVGIGAFAFFLYSEELSSRGLILQSNIGPLIAVLAIGVCVGFLPHNFNPARIMMGDGGALLLGLLLAVSTSVVGGRTTSENDFIGTTYFFLAPIAIPLLILGVPILDAAFAIVRRATTRTSLATADKGHLHHRLINLGHGQRRSVLILWTWTALLSAFVLYPIVTEESDIRYLPFGIGALAIMLFTVLHPSVREQRRRNSTPGGGIERPDQGDQNDQDDDVLVGAPTTVPGQQSLFDVAEQSPTGASDRDDGAR